jgi:hypothetical protein
MAETPTLSFERREYKYLVPVALIPDLREAIRPACKLDSYAQENGLYTIRSLYLDTPDFRLYWANDREQDRRFKVRIRTYPGSRAPVFLEVKQRLLDSIYKTRVAMAHDAWQRLLERPEELERMPWRSEFERSLAGRFLYHYHLYHLEPAVLVEYEREAWVSVLDSYGRATFDLHIRGQEPLGLTLEGAPNAWRAADSPVHSKTVGTVAILELKFGRVAPPWMSALVKAFDLQRFAFSKYCYSLLETRARPIESRVARQPQWTALV